MVCGDTKASAQRNYFELFHLEAHFKIDEEDLGRRFRTLQTKFHPDKFSHASAAEQRMAAQLSAELNAAFNCLKDPVKRAGYLLECKGAELRELERKPMDGEFLMTQIMLREGVEEAESSEDLAKIAGDTQQLIDEQTELFEKTWLADDLEQAGSAWVRLLYLQKLQSEIERRQHD